MSRVPTKADDIEFRKDVLNTKKVLQPAPLPPSQPATYAYVPTMVNIAEFDQNYSLLKVAKKPPKANEKKVAAREQNKKYLIEQLHKNTEKMKQIKKCK